MAFKKNNVYFSTIFEPRGTTTKGPDVGYQEDGVDISNTYYPLSAGGTAPAVTNYKVSSADLNTKFAGIGTVSYDPVTGVEYVFNATDTTYISTVMLDSTHVCVCYAEYDTAYRGSSRIGTINDTTITWGNEYVFNNSSTQYISAVALDSTHICVSYQGNSDYGTSIIGTVSGNSISWGNEYVFNSGSTYRISLTKIDSTHIVVCYEDFMDSSHGKARFGIISGTGISWGSVSVFSDYPTSVINVTTLDSTHFLVTYQFNISSNYYSYIKMGIISGTSISWGTHTVLKYADIYIGKAEILDSTHICVSYGYPTSKIVFGTISGTTVTFGDEVEYNNATSFGSKSLLLDPSHICMFYSDGGNSNYGTSRKGTISGTTITWSSEYVFNSGITDHISVVALDSTHFCVCYRDQGNSSKGTGIIEFIP